MQRPLPPARVANGKCEGRKSLAETNPDAVALAKPLSRKRPKGGQMSLRAASAEMAARGFLNEQGVPFNHKSAATMLVARTRAGQRNEKSRRLPPRACRKFQSHDRMFQRLEPRQVRP
jgi:hypothetical protein